MKTFTHTIRDDAGIHARPAGMLVNKVKALGCPVTLRFGEREADASRLFSIMSLGLKCGDTISIEVNGEDSAADELELFLRENI